LRLRFWNFLAGEGFEFPADYIGGKAGAQEAPIHCGHLALIDFAAKGAEFAFEALADDCGFVDFFCGLSQSGFDVAVRDAAGAQVPRNSKSALAPDFRALADELFGKALVINHLGALQTVHNIFQKVVVIRSAAKELLHFVYGVSAAHEGADGSVVQFRFGLDLAGLSKHGGSIEEREFTVDS
jgi:hypothetical protein